MKKLNLNEKQQAQHLKLLIYGASGVGKTTAIKTLPTKGTLVLSTEPQTPTRLSKTNYECWQIESWDDIDQVAYKELLKSNHRIIIIDSISMLDIMSQEQIALSDRAKAKGTSQIANMYEDVLTREDYRVLNVRWTRFFLKYTNLDKHIIMISREAERRDDRTGIIFYAPEITGKLSLSIGGYFTEVFRLTAKPKDGKFQNEFTCKKMDNTITKGHESLSLYETGKNGTVDLTEITNKIFNGGKK